MDIREVLEPEWKKFILPLVLIILFSFVINTFYSISSITNKYGCEIVSLVQEQNDNIKQNNTLAFNETVKKSISLIQRMQNDADYLELNKNEKKNKVFFEPVYSFLNVIDPALPVPCELQNTRFCEYYVNKQTYDCTIRMIGQNETGGLNQAVIFEKIPMKDYTKSSIINLGSNVLLLFVEGYLVSSLILFAYRKIRKK